MAVAHTTHVEHRESFLTRYIFSQDHKIIGIQYLITSMAMALIGGAMAVLMRLQLGWPGTAWPGLGALLPRGFPGGVMDPSFYLSLLTMHGTIMVFFVLTISLTGGFGNFLIPLQIGARDMAFPFLNMLSYWLIPPSIVLLLASFAVRGGAPMSGWTAYPPLSALPQAVAGSGPGQTLWILSLALLIVASLFGSLNYITTVLQLRTRGMSMSRLPITVWAMLVTAVISLLAFPVLVAGAVLLLFDRLGGTSFYLPAGMVVGGRPAGAPGGDPLLWQHLFWFLGHPEVYILLLPAAGMVADVLATHARRPVFGYRSTVVALVTIAVLSFLVWGHHMYVSGMNPWLSVAFMTGTVFISVPAALVTFNLIATLWGGRIRFTPPMLFALGFLALFVSGGLGGLFLGDPSTDIYLHDTYFVVGHFHLVMASSVLFGLFAAMYHWYPKMFGRMLNERLGKLHFWLAFPSTYVTFFPMHILGIHGMMRRIFSTQMYPELARLQPLSVLISVAAFVSVAAHLLFVVNFVWSLWRGEKAGRNPWRSTTLEWSTASPPPHGNWEGELPVVHRGPYEYYNSSDAEDDFIPQAAPAPAYATARNGGR